MTRGRRPPATEDVVIADIDTGVDVRHPDLAANMWRNPGETPGNGVDDEGNGYVDDVYGIDTAYNDTVPMDDYGHGTHTAGIAAAAGDNEIGVAGLGLARQDHGAQVHHLLGRRHRRRRHRVHRLRRAPEARPRRQRRRHQCILGGGAPDLFLRNAVARAGDAGIVFCAAAGNGSSDNDTSPFYPASFDCPTILSVAATAPDGRLAYVSYVGRLTVDLAAPGEDVLSTLPDGRYGRKSGTSMAAPFVAGAVALCASAHPAETAEQRVDRILGSVRADDRLTREVRSGGTLDAAAAVRSGDPAGDLQAPVTVALGGDARPLRCFRGPHALRQRRSGRVRGRDDAVAGRRRSLALGYERRGPGSQGRNEHASPGVPVVRPGGQHRGRPSACCRLRYHRARRRPSPGRPAATLAGEGRLRRP